MKRKIINKRVVCSLVMVLAVCLSLVLTAQMSKAGKYYNRTALTDEEYRLFYCIVYCEAGGESYEAQLGVANVILNRVKFDGWPDTLKEVIYQKHQFSPVKNGYLNKTLREYDQGKFTSKWHQSVIKAVDDAVAGKNNIGNREYFMTPEALKKTLGNNYYDRKDIGNTAFFNTNW